MLCWNSSDKEQKRVNKKKANQSFNELTKSKDFLLKNVTLKGKIHLPGCYVVLVDAASFHSYSKCRYEPHAADRLNRLFPTETSP